MYVCVFAHVYVCVYVCVGGGEGDVHLVQSHALSHTLIALHRFILTTYKVH